MSKTFNNHIAQVLRRETEEVMYVDRLPLTPRILHIMAPAPKRAYPTNILHITLQVHSCPEAYSRTPFSKVVTVPRSQLIFSCTS